MTPNLTTQQQRHQHACDTNQGIKPPTYRAWALKASSPQLIEHRLSEHQAPNFDDNAWTQQPMQKQPTTSTTKTTTYNLTTLTTTTS